MAEVPKEGRLLKRRTSRRGFLKGAAILGGGLAIGAVTLKEITTWLKKKAPEYGAPADEPIKYYTVRIEHGEEEEGHIRKDPHMQGDKIGEIPTDRDLIINNVTKVWGSETGAAHGITTFPDGQSRGWWFKISWPSKENPEQKIPGYVSSQFVTIEKSYDKPL